MCSGWWHSSLIFACVFILYFTFIVDDDRLHLMTIKYCTFFHYLQVYCWLVFKGFSPFFSCSLRETATEIQFSKLLNFSFRKKNIFSMFWQVEEEKKIGVFLFFETPCNCLKWTLFFCCQKKTNKFSFSIKVYPEILQWLSVFWLRK